MKNNKLALLVAFFVSCTLAFSGCSKIGFVSDSSVTSADATASAVRNTIVNFLSDADTAGYGMLEGAETVIEITVDNSSWTVYAADVSSFKQSESVTWGTEQDGIKANESKESVSSAERLLGISLANNLAELEKGSIFAYCKNGNCLNTLYSSDFTDKFSLHSDVPTVTDLKSGSFAWNGSDGVINGGYIIGSNPKLINAA